MNSNRWLVLAVVSSALLLIVVDMSVLYTALPALTADLEANASEKLWIINAYALVMAGLLPIMGSLTDKYGPKLLFTAGMLVFAGASLIAAFSPTPTVLIAGRAILAVGAAMMMPATLAIVRHVFEDPKERSLAIGVWAAIASGGAAFGPVVGGIMLEFFWWGSVFLINVPIVAVAFLVTVALVPAVGGNAGQRIDITSSVLILSGLVTLVYAIKELSQGINPVIVLIFGISLVLLVAFYVLQRKRSDPMIDFQLFQNPVFLGGAIAALVSCATLLGMQFALTQRFQLLDGMTALQAGVAILPLPLAAFVAGPIAGLLLPRVGAIRLLWISMAVLGLGAGTFALTSNHGIGVQIATLAITGLAIGATITGASSAILMNAPVHGAGSAASVEEVSYELGGAIGVAVLGSAMAGIYTLSFVSPEGLVELDEARDSFDAAILRSRELGPDAAEQLMTVASTAFNISFLWVMAIASVGSLATALVLLILDRRTKPQL